MKLNQLPKGVTAKPVEKIATAGVVLNVAPEGDLRIFKSAFDMRRPFHIEAKINGAWRQLIFSNGKGRFSERGCITYVAALNMLVELRKQVYGDTPQTPITGSPQEEETLQTLGDLYTTADRIGWDEHSRSLRDRLIERLDRLREQAEGK